MDSHVMFYIRHPPIPASWNQVKGYVKQNMELASFINKALLPKHLHLRVTGSSVGYS